MTDIRTLLDFDAPRDLLADRVILLTGASGGLGKALATRLARCGATTILLGKRVEALEALYDRIQDAGGPEPALYPMDLEGAGPDDYADLAANINAHFGRLDGLIHNAAWLGAPAPVRHYDPFTWMRAIQVNLNAPFLLTRACLDLLERGSEPRVLFTSDARQGAYWGAYGVSKAGLEGFIHILAEELEDAGTIRVNGIDPGPLRTPLRTRAFPGEDPTGLRDPAWAVPAFLYLLGPAGAGRNGEILRLQPDRSG